MLKGVVVQVFLKNGKIYEGVYHALSADNVFTLKMVRAVERNKLVAIPLSAYVTLQEFKGNDIVRIQALKVDPTYAERSGKEKEGFMTDADISGAKLDTKMRELQAWVADEPEGSNLTFTEDSYSTGEWDQFATNEKLFGVRSEFNEELYTTKLDKSSKQYKEKEKEAAKIADEILKNSSSNVHLADERGRNMNKELDEEALYGAVIRETSKEPRAKALAKLENHIKKEGKEKMLDDSIKIDKVAEDFKEFSTNEKALLNQKKQEIIQKDRQSKTKELKNFSQKLNEPKKNESQAPETKKAEPAFKLNANASEFKPNPNASSFVPSSPSFSTSSYNQVTSPYSPTGSQGGHYHGPRKYNKYAPATAAAYFADRLKNDGQPKLRKNLCKLYHQNYKAEKVNAITPFWSFGQKSYRYLFTAMTNNMEDMGYGGYNQYGYNYQMMYQPMYGNMMVRPNNYSGYGGPFDGSYSPPVINYEEGARGDANEKHGQGHSGYQGNNVIFDDKQALGGYNKMRSPSKKR